MIIAELSQQMLKSFETDFNARLDYRIAAVTRYKASDYGWSSQLICWQWTLRYVDIFFILACYSWTAYQSLPPFPPLATVENIILKEKRGNCVPIFVQLPADLVTPCMAYLRIAKDSKYSFLLESVVGGESVARYSFIGAGMSLVFHSVCFDSQFRSRPFKDN